jgi:hypothetical protein
MADEVLLTISELGKSIKRQFGGKRVPDWKLRRVVDELEEIDAISVRRAARYRMILGRDVPIVAAALRRVGWLPDRLAVAGSDAGSVC